MINFVIVFCIMILVIILCILLFKEDTRIYFCIKCDKDTKHYLHGILTTTYFDHITKTKEYVCGNCGYIKDIPLNYKGEEIK